MDYKEKVIALLNSQELSREQKEKLNGIFPELKESEDERISKEIIYFLSRNTFQFGEDIDKYHSWVAWLEKQVEKPIDKVEPKFKHGDRVRNKKSGLEQTLGSCIEDVYEGAFPFRIKDQDDWELVEHEPDDNRLIPRQGEYYICINDYTALDGKTTNSKGKVYKSTRDGYINDDRGFALSWKNSCTEAYFSPIKDEDWIVCENNNVSRKPIQYKTLKTDKVIQRAIMRLENNGFFIKFRLWTINDAKDGDVLATEQTVFIFKHIDKAGLSFCKSYCEVIGNSKLGLGFDFSINGVYPATKEQRDTLFKAMADAGYEWNAEKKELKKISKNI